jgi:nucleoside phosphorylase
MTDVTDLPTIGLITALPHEYAAMKALLANSREVYVPGRGTGRRYMYGEISSVNGGIHTVALSLLVDMGNNVAAIRASRMLDVFSNVYAIIMVGIAGAVPSPDAADEHVRLGDIVVSDQGGVVQYDFDKETIDVTEHRHRPRPPAAVLVEAVRLLQADVLAAKKPWLPYIAEASASLNIARPSEDTDRLADSTDPHLIVPHPRDPYRLPGQPRIFLGPIAAANKLLKNPRKRDALRERFKVKAVEMESSGIADATWDQSAGYLVVRGTCDYCDKNKGDAWQRYAAVAAAAYTRALLEFLPAFPIAASQSAQQSPMQSRARSTVPTATGADDLFLATVYYSIDDAQEALHQAHSLLSEPDIRPSDCDQAIVQVQRAQRYLERLWDTVNQTMPLPPAFVQLHRGVKLRRFSIEEHLQDLMTRTRRFRTECRPVTAEMEVRRQELKQACLQLIAEFQDLGQMLPGVVVGVRQPASEQSVSNSAATSPPPEPLRSLQMAEPSQLHIDASRMSDADVDALVDLLLKCRSVQSRSQRDSIVQRLGSDIMHSIPRDAVDRNDMLAIVQACRDYENGIDALIRRIHFYERGSNPMKQIASFLQAFVVV